MSETADIVIIGAGVVGCSLAYHLALQGASRVAVVDKDLICSGSTGRSAGGIRQQFATELNIALSLESIRMFERMPEELGVDPGFRKVGYLFLATTEAELALFRKNVVLQQRCGVSVQMVNPDDIRRLVPFVHLDGILGGTHCPTDGYAAPYEVTMGYAAAARRRGVRIFEQRAVTGITQASGRVTGIESAAGPIHAAIVVNAAGAFAGMIGFLPSPLTLVSWLHRAGFRNVRVTDVTPTTSDEQRTTDWMRFESLIDFLDPNDHSKTIEGYPAPRRAIVLAEAP